MVFDLSLVEHAFLVGISPKQSFLVAMQIVQVSGFLPFDCIKNLHRFESILTTNSSATNCSIKVIGESEWI